MFSISTGNVRQRQSLNQYHNINDTNTLTQSDRSKKYDPTFHFWLIGFLCLLVIVICGVTFFYAPRPPKHSQIHKMLNEHMRRKRLYQIDFDGEEFTDYIASNENEDDILQKSINHHYGDDHSRITENNGWNIVFEGPNHTKPGLICEQIGCLISIKLLDVFNKLKSSNGHFIRPKHLYISFVYVMSTQENEMGIAQIWIDTKSTFNPTDTISDDAQILDAYVPNTKAISKHMTWTLDPSDLAADDDLYFHALIISDETRPRREGNKFKILGFDIRSD